MLDSNGVRQLAYVVRVDDLKPIEGRDRVECAVVGGWTIMVRKNAFKVGDPAIYFEIDSKLPAEEPFLFLERTHYSIKTQKYKTPSGHFFSQGLLMSAEDFGWEITQDQEIRTNRGVIYPIGSFLTDVLKVTYYVPQDNVRKASNPARELRVNVKKEPFRTLMRYSFGRKLVYALFTKNKRKSKKKQFPTHFQFIKKTDQERCENMSWVLENKSPFIRTQKCDGSSGTFILERKRFGYEFYVCSRNVRMLAPEQECFFGDTNYYWEVALKYDIENKLKDYLNKHKDLKYVCWQGEICAPKIQGNPHNLKETHFFCFHMIDSKRGKYDIREAAKIWKEYDMEIVPIDEELYIMPDDFEEFKASAYGNYSSEVCGEGGPCEREGYVYYLASDPNFSFKNVSREYLAKK